MRSKTALAFVASMLALVSCGDDKTGTTTDNTTQGQVDCSNDVCILSGVYTKDLKLTADTSWLLRGGVFIGDDANKAVLTVEPGTTIFGESSTGGMLVIRRGSQIIAEGTKDQPIIFTSSKNVGSRARGDWGGLIINGRARVNSCAGEDNVEVCEAFGEGGTGYYGGNDDNDNSGKLRYVRIEFAGRLISPDNELNGLALQGVGSGTTIEFIQVHMGKDDGLEFFGGTVSFKYVLVTGAADDNLDWTDGWRGKGQFFVAQQYEDAGDNGIEADNNAENNASEPRSKPLLSNLTLVGSPESKLSDLGMLLREGTGANISNAVVLDWNEACLDVDHQETFTNAMDGQALSGQLTISNSIISCATAFAEKEDDAFKVSDFFNTLNVGNMVGDPKLADPTNTAQPDLRPTDGSPAATGAVIPNDPFFTKVAFKGGIDPDDDWTAGWTTAERN